MRYVYGITAALLLGGAAATLTVGPVGAQTAQNEPGTISAATPRPNAPMSFADLAARLQPAVVNISTKQTIQVRNQQLPPGFEEFFRRFGAPVPDTNEPSVRRGSSLGSGFIISPDGYVVTNNHVIAPARSEAVVETITVTLSDRKEYEARVVGRDPASDLAVLKINATNLPFVRFGDSTRTRVGDWVVAIGNPFGLGGTVTAGIVSALHRNINAGQYDRYIQSDASINQGNSGGPMFDLNGNVIGINTALISPTGGNVGIGFAIPAEQARPIVEALRRGERPHRGYLGITVQALDESAATALGLPKNHGEIVQSITPGGPAARAGIQPGDVVTRINNRVVGPDESLSFIVASLPANARVPIEIIRNGERRTLTAVVSARPTDEEVARLTGAETPGQVRETEESQQTTGQRAARAGLGLSVQALTPEIARTLRLTDPNIRGVIVSAVDPNSDAGAKGFNPGDIILSINQRPVATPEDAAAAVEAARRAGRSSVLLQVRRGNEAPRYIGVDLVARR